MSTSSFPLNHRKSSPNLRICAISAHQNLQTPDHCDTHPPRRKSLPEPFMTIQDPSLVAEQAERYFFKTRPRNRGPRIIEWDSKKTLPKDEDYLNRNAADAPLLDESQRSSIDCQFCRMPKAKDRDKQEWCRELFHGPCTACESSSPSNAAPDLCEFCSHLRLRHLFSCTPETFVIWISDARTAEEFEIDQRSCSFCRLVANTPEANFESPPAGAGKFYAIARLPHDIGNLDIDSEYVWNHQISSWYPPMLVDSSEPAQPEQVVIGDHHTFHKKLIDDHSWASARSWIDECCSSHFECSIEKPSLEIPHFRLIDVQKRCLVEASICDSFVALSYVWGTHRNPSWIQTTLSTIDDLQQPGALDQSRLPQTVEDALRSCEKLGERYIWIDQLCIVQDDMENKQYHIGRMGSIYAVAKLVMIAWSGNSMNDGLAGVSRERSLPPDTTVVDGMRCHFVVPERRNMTEDSAWDVRGWTFQEGVLARRRLYFSESQMSFECENYIRHENLLTDVYHLTRADYYNSVTVRNVRLQELLEMYRKRHLTNESDACYAFSGILEASQGAGNFLYGHPLANFDEWLLWFPNDEEFRPRGWERHEEFRGIELNHPPDGTVFPSWSWSHVLGGVSFPPANAFCAPLVAWAHREGEVWRPIRASGAFETTDWQLAVAIAWNNGCILPKSPLPSITTMDHKSYCSVLEERWPCFEDFWNEAYATTLSSALGEATMQDIPPHPGQLFTVAQSARFALDWGHRTWHDTRLTIRNERRETVGTLYGSDPRLKRDIFPSMSSTAATYEFIGLSISWFPDDDYDIYSKPWQLDYEGETEMYSLQDSEGVQRSVSLQVAVMLINRVGPIARRVSVGSISLPKWIDAQRTWKRIILE